MITFLIIAIASCLWFSYNADTNFWHPKWMIARLLASSLVAFEIFKIMPLAGIFVGYLLVSACFICSHEMIKHFCCEQGKKNFSFTDRVYGQFFDILSLALLFLFVPINFVQIFFDSLPIVAALGCYLSFFPVKRYVARIKQTALCHGLSGNSSINSTLMSIVSIGSLASSIPYLNYAGWILGAAGCFKTKGSAGIGGVILGSFVFFMYKSQLISLSILAAIILTSPLYWNYSKKFFPGQGKFLFLDHPLFCMSGRSELWSFAIEKVWKPYGNFLTGIGFGTFSYAYPLIQIQQKEKMFTDSKQVLTALHNDLLQLFIEGGVIGIVLLAFALFEIISVGHTNPFMMAMLSCFLVNSFANYPARLAPDSFTFIMAIKLIV